MIIWICGYKVNIDFSKNINEQELLQETRIILSLIYRDYICFPEKRKELLEIDREQIKREEEMLKEKYSINLNKRNQLLKEKSIEIKNKSNSKIEMQNNNVYLAKIKEEKWHKKFLNKILNFFKKKKIGRKENNIARN